MLEENTQSTIDDVEIQSVQLQQVNENKGQGFPLFKGNLSLIKDVKVKLEVIVGQAEISVGELFSLKDQSIVKLDSETSAPVEIRLDGKTIAKGYLVVVDDNLGVRIDQILPADV